MKDVYVVAHTESIHHVENKVGGWFDTGLTERGQRQADAVAQRLAVLVGSEPTEIVTSDLLRARQTADRIASRLDCPLTETQALREMSQGIGEGRPEPWLHERFVPAPANNRLDHRSIEGSETKRELAMRIYAALDAILADGNATKIIVTHGYAMTFVVAAWIRMPIEAVGYINLRSTSGGITHLHEDDYLQNRGVRFLNDTTHLDGI